MIDIKMPQNHSERSHFQNKLSQLGYSDASVPKTNYSEIGPEGAMYKATDSGFINTDIYLKYIQHLDKFILGNY